MILPNSEFPISITAQLEKVEQLLLLEQQEDAEQYREQVLQTPLRERQRQGTSWYPVRLSDSSIGLGGRWVLSLQRKVEFNQPHQFSSGAQVALFSNAAPQEKPLHGTVIGVDQQAMQLSLNHDDELPDWIDDHQLGVDLLFDEYSYKEMKLALQKVKDARAGSRLEKIRNILYGLDSQEALPTQPQNPVATHLMARLNDAQQLSLSRLAQSPYVFIIHGPPGTGKTTTLVAAVEQILTTEQQVLVCAPSNAAADLLTLKIAAQGKKVLRVGNPARMSEEILPFTLEFQLSGHTDAKEVKRLRKLAFELKRMAYKHKKYFDKSEREQKKAMLKEARNILDQIKNMEQYAIDWAKSQTQVFVSTLVGAAQPILADKRFSTVFIDEAGQALEPATWIPILKADRVVLAGDHQQLPPTVKSTEAARQGFSETLMEKAMKSQAKAFSQMLDTQYRMHADIMAFSSAEFYENRLLAHESVAKARFGHDNGPEETAPLLFIDTAGTGFEEVFNPASVGISNPEEAELLNRHLQQWLEWAGKQAKIDLSQVKIAVISPYREQVEFLKKILPTGNSTNFPQIRVGTVDGFQGQEADLVYISLVRSNPNQEIGFLKDIRRMNVAMTRAKKRLVVVGDGSTLSAFAFYDRFLNQLQQANAYRSAWEFINF